MKQMARPVKRIRYGYLRQYSEHCKSVLREHAVLQFPWGDCQPPLAGNIVVSFFSAREALVRPGGMSLPGQPS
jgi:hypothetical protein